MKLVDNWKAILTKAWSVRLLVVAAVLSGGEVVMGMLNADFFGLPQNTFAALAGLVTASALVARVVAQNDLESGNDAE